MIAATLPTLRDLGNARDILDEFLIETEGEVTPELQELWDKLEGDTETKIERWALWIQDRVGKAKEIKDEEARLSARRKAIESACERSKAELKRQMERIGKAKVNGLLCSIAIQNNPPSVTCALTDDQLRDAYYGVQGDDVGQFVREVPASYRIDRDAVMTAHKAGDAIPAEIAITVGSHLRIR